MIKVYHLKIKILLISVAWIGLLGASEGIEDTSYKTALVCGVIEGASKGFMATLIAFKTLEQLDAFSSTESSLKPLAIGVALGGALQAYLNVRHNLQIDSTPSEDLRKACLKGANFRHKSRATREGMLWAGGQLVLLGMGNMNSRLVVVPGGATLLRVCNEIELCSNLLKETKTQISIK